MNRQKLYSRGWWITKDEEVIHVSKLDDNHLKNILNFLIKKAYAYEAQQINNAYALPEPHGEMAQLWFEQELQALEDSNIAMWWLANHPFTVHLLDEIEFREKSLIDKKGK